MPAFVVPELGKGQFIGFPFLPSYLPRWKSILHMMIASEDGTEHESNCLTYHVSAMCRFAGLLLNLPPYTACSPNYSNHQRNFF